MKDQWDTETYYFSWLGLDLWLKLSVPERITQGHNDLYCTTKDHIVQKYTNQKEEDTVLDTWEGYKLKLEYPPKIDFQKRNCLRN